MKKFYHLFLLLILFTQISCAQENFETRPLKQNTSFDTTIKTIHIMVALCDNQYQGIVPVPEAIGNGQKPNANLYWGCAFGIKTYFKKSADWQLVKTVKIDSLILERLVFKHKTLPYYLVADAYNGKEIKRCTSDFLYACAGKEKDTIYAVGKTLGINGNAQLISYIGHDGLMDFDLKDVYNNIDNKTRDAIILACQSRGYFTDLLKSTKANPVLWTKALMCPEAYTLHDALDAWMRKENDKILSNAKKAYAKYQKCSENAAGTILVEGYIKE